MLALARLNQPQPTGGKGGNWRIHAVYNLGGASFRHQELTNEKGPETLTCAPPVGGAIAFADRGYVRTNEMAAYLQAQGDKSGDFIVRVGWNALRLENADGSPFNLIETLTEMSKQPAVPDDPTPREWTGRAPQGRRKHIRAMPLCLVILPLPPDKAGIAREKVRRIARKQQTELNPNTLLAAGCLMLTTSLPAEFDGAEIRAVYRSRWQIELAFGRLKSLIHVDRLPTRWIWVGEAESFRISFSHC